MIRVKWQRTYSSRVNGTTTNLNLEPVDENGASHGLAASRRLPGW